MHKRQTTWKKNVQPKTKNPRKINKNVEKRTVKKTGKEGKKKKAKKFHPKWILSQE